MGRLEIEGRTAMAVLLERGHSQSAVARLLGVSEGTVRHHRKRWASGRQSVLSPRKLSVRPRRHDHHHQQEHPRLDRVARR